jgi:hypothetical protein
VVRESRKIIQIYVIVLSFLVTVEAITDDVSLRWIGHVLLKFSKDASLALGLLDSEEFHIIFGGFET